MGRTEVRPILIVQADAGDAVDEDEGIRLHLARCFQRLIALAGAEQGQLLDVIQPPHLAGQLHHPLGRAQSGQPGPHQGLISRHMAVPGREDGLEVVVHLPLPDKDLEVAALLHRVDAVAVVLYVELPDFALGGVLDLVHRKIGVSLEGVEVGGIVRIPCYAAGHPNAQLLAVRQGGAAPGKALFQLPDVLPHGLLRLIAVEQQQELIAGEPRHHGAAGHALLQAVGRLAQIDVAPVVAVGIIDGLEVIEVRHHQGRAAHHSGLLEQLAADPEEGLTTVQPGEGVVIALVLDAAALGYGCFVVVGAQGHDGVGQPVQLPDAGAGELRDGLMPLLRIRQLLRELSDRLGQTDADEECAAQTKAQRQQDRKAHEIRHRLGEAEEVVPSHHADKQPPFAREGGVAVVEADLADADDLIGTAARIMPVALGAVEGQLPSLLLQRGRLLAGVGGDMDLQLLAPQVGGRGSQQIASVVVVLQFVPRELGVHIAFQHLDAQNAVHRAVVQNQRLRVGDGLPVIAQQRIGQGRPAAIIRRSSGLLPALIGSLEGPDIKGILFHIQILLRRRPRLVRSDAEGLHQLCRSALEHHVGVVRRGGGFRVEVPQIDAGQPVAGGAVCKVVGVQDEEDAADLLGAERLEQPRSGRFQQGQALAAGRIQRIERDRPLVQHLPSLIVDKARKLRQVLCLLELGLNIPGTVLHLLVENVHRVLIQSEGDAADPNGRGHQHDHDDQHDHQRRKDGDKDGVFFSFCFISHQKLHGLSLLSLVFVPSQPSYWRRASQRL